MRIGIITFHRAFNAGAVLQAFALSRILRQLGHEPVFPALNLVGHDPLPDLGSDRLGRAVARQILAQRNRYECFVREHFHEVACVPEKLGDVCETAVFGSDQIWNAKLLRYDWNPNGGARYFIGETVDRRVRRIAYGASIGDRPLSREDAERLRSAVSGFSALSVRERLSAEGLRDEHGRAAEIVEDPTVLLSASDYSPIMSPSPVRKGRYVLVYALHQTPFVEACAKKASERLGLPVVVLPMYYKRGEDSLSNCTFDFGPGELLSYVRDAECVLASSFHVTVFSILFGKPFVSLRNQVDETESRPAAILRTLGLSRRLVNPETPDEDWLPCLSQPIEQAAFGRLAELRRKSLGWLERELTLPTIGRGEDCCGCTACSVVCPSQAIEMKPDGRGFVRPVVNPALCARCGSCERTCDFKNREPKDRPPSPPTAYSARHLNFDEVLQSRSGAVFAAVSDYVLKLGGVVYGAALTDGLLVAHRRATTRQERDAFRGSKYVQSDLRGVFASVLADMRAGKTVLFSGTACQTAALRRLVSGTLRDRLYLMDIVCHGVMSPADWLDHVAAVEKIVGERPISVDFRDKIRFGWDAHRETYRFASHPERAYWDGVEFYRSATYRDSCYACRYCSLDRPSDLTIGDFWGWRNSHPDLNRDDRGVNIVLVNTERGRALFDAAKGDLEFRKEPLESVLQPNLMRPTPRPVLATSVGDECRRLTEERDRAWAEVNELRRSFSYRTGRLVTWPFRLVRRNLR